MQALVAKEKEPITPFLAKIGALRKRGVSCILVMGGSGDYFGVSDTVICMDSYACKDVTAEARAIDQRFGSSVALQDINAAYGSITPRCPVSVYPGSHGERACSAHYTGISGLICRVQLQGVMAAALMKVFVTVRTTFLRYHQCVEVRQGQVCCLCDAHDGMGEAP